MPRALGILLKCSCNDSSVYQQQRNMMAFARVHEHDRTTRALCHCRSSPKRGLALEVLQQRAAEKSMPELFKDLRVELPELLNSVDEYVQTSALALLASLLSATPGLSFGRRPAMSLIRSGCAPSVCIRFGQSKEAAHHAFM